jgi:predicted O-methyltransferase YrrM
MEHIYNNIDGWFTFPDLYKSMVDKAPNDSHFVEVGTWLGKSAAYLAVEIANSNKKIKFDCVDLWENNQEYENESVVKENIFYETFLKNVEPIKNFLNPIKLPSLEAAKLYEDNSLDFVFIDASHIYENVKNDIEAWYPKLKSKGILAGHDYDCGDVRKAVEEFTSKNSYIVTINSEQCWGFEKR